MRIVFFGIYALGSRALQELLKRRSEIALVVSKPETAEDRQPVVELARDHALPFVTPTLLDTEEFRQAVVEATPDLIAVAGYHKKIPASILAIPKLGTINLHGSLLPRYRGPCPWKHMIIHGEREAGVTVHRMTEKLDKGAILKQRSITISETETGGSLFEKIADVGAGVLADTIDEVVAGTVRSLEQDESLASYQSAPEDAQCRIDWQCSAETVSLLVRGLNPRPGAWSSLGDRRYRILKLAFTGRRSEKPPGVVCSANSRSLTVATSNFDVALEQVSRDGESTDCIAELYARFHSGEAMHFLQDTTEPSR